MSQRQHIIEGATAMLLDDGPRSVRIEDIASRLGVSTRTIYEAFGDKSNLMYESLTWYFEKRRLEVCGKVDIADNVIEEIFLILGSMKRDEKEEKLIQNLKKFYPDVHFKLQHRAHDFFHNEFDRLLDRGIKEELFPKDTNRDLALMTATYTFSALAERRYPRFEKGILPQIAFEYVLVHFFRGLATPKGIALIDELEAKYKKKNDEYRKKNGNLVEPF